MYFGEKKTFFKHWCVYKCAEWKGIVLLSIDGKIPCLLLFDNYMLSRLISTAVGSGPLRAERRRCKARREILTNPGLVTTRRSILGPPAEGRPGPSKDKLLKNFPPLQLFSSVFFSSGKSPCAMKMNCWRIFLLCSFFPARFSHQESLLVQ